METRLQGNDHNWNKGTQTVIAKEGIWQVLHDDGRLVEREIAPGDSVSHHLGMLALLPQIRDNAKQLAGLSGRFEVGGEAVHGIHAVGQDDFKSKWFFSKKTGLLRKAAGMVTLPSGTNVETETLFHDFKEVDGVVFPQLITEYAGENKIVTVLVTTKVIEIKIPHAVDDATFLLP